MASNKTNFLNTIYNASSCGVSTNYCGSGYSLYFPCLTEVTRGQNICFDFYIADNTTQDVIDLRDVDAISLELNGLFGCSYGTFSYPDNIESLQSENPLLIYENSFEKINKCTLDVIASDYNSGDEINLLSEDYYIGSPVKLSAYDTPTHIFLGWVTNIDDEMCENPTLNDIIYSKNNELNVVVRNNMVINALYRERKIYKITVDNSNENSIFKIIYDGKAQTIINKNIENFTDDYVEVLEGYTFKAICIPHDTTFDSDSDSDDYKYKFIKWKDDDQERIRTFIAGENTLDFESENEIKLFAYCEKSDEDIDYDNSYIIDPNENKFDEEGIHILTKTSDINEYIYTGDAKTLDFSNTSIKYIGNDGYLCIKSGEIVFDSFDIKDNVRIDIINIKADTEARLYIKTNDVMRYEDISSELKDLSFYINNLNNSPITISVEGNVIIESIKIYKEIINNKGKAQLCLSSDDTLNIATGNISVSGAINIKGNTYGLHQTLIGNVNRLNKINIIKDE